MRNATERNLEKRNLRKEFIESNASVSKRAFQENYLQFTLRTKDSGVGNGRKDAEQDSSAKIRQSASIEASKVYKLRPE